MVKDRIYWVDSLRGIAILMMVVFHFVFTLNFLGIHSFIIHGGFWGLFARTIQFIFLTLVGFSLYLSFIKRGDYQPFLKHQLIRAGKLFLVALGVTLVTYLIIPHTFIRFGVLHFISVGIVLGALVVNRPKTLVLLIPSSLILGVVLTYFTVNTHLLMPFGLVYKSFYSLDYFPIFPWIGLVFSGILIATVLDRLDLLKNPFYGFRLKPLEALGKRSLLIYILHEPFVLAVIWLFFT